MPSPPTGTVTFLFTDIAGSTQRWESGRAAMASALARHNAILDRAIASNAGHVFKTVGDAYCAAFADAASALAAAVDAPRALHAALWDEIVAASSSTLRHVRPTCLARRKSRHSPPVKPPWRSQAAG
ncbi:MAG: hypothetical protein IT332_05025 [Ardenticatenales bacterium]|nr:hypothetical protein [Ardenticatenales bacterium]